MLICVGYICCTSSYVLYVMTIALSLRRQIIFILSHNLELLEILSVYQIQNYTKIVLTTSQTTAFFENANQMAIPHATVLQLRHEGITSVADLVDFDKTSISQIADNLRRPGGRIPDPMPGAPEGATIPTPPFIFGAKSQTRLNVACKTIRFYNMVGRVLTAHNIQWDPVMSRFK